MKHYAFRTECTYISWIKRFILFHDKKPKDLGEEETQLVLSGMSDTDVRNQLVNTD